MIYRQDKMSIVVICCNEKDHERAERTLEQIRTKGKWAGPLAWVAIDFDPNKEFVAKWRVQVIKKAAFDMTWLWDLRRKHPYEGTDGREYSKLVQFSKWRVFCHEFKIYKSLLYLDAGMYIGKPITSIFTIDHKNKIIAPDDRFPFDDPSKTFRKQWDSSCMPEKFNELEEYIGKETLEKGGYFLNCMWLMDTSIIHANTQNELMALARRFPISRTNEMAVMNLYFLQYWQPLPEQLNGVHVFDWTERFGHKTNEYMMLKYPHFQA